MRKSILFSRFIDGRVETSTNAEFEPAIPIGWKDVSHFSPFRRTFNSDRVSGGFALLTSIAMLNVAVSPPPDAVMLIFAIPLFSPTVNESPASFSPGPDTDP